MRIAIIGGGIAGLAAAYELELAREKGIAVEYDLFEAGQRLGGVLSSALIDGSVIEHGPDSFLTEKPATADLCRELGLASQLVASNDSQRKTFILVRNRLVPLPDGLMFLVPTKLFATALSPLFSLATKLRMAWELMLPPKNTHPGDESVAALVRRHYGQQVVDRLADPLLSGIYGGDAEQLSAPSVLPRFVEMEAKYGSLTRGMLAAIHTRKAAQAAARQGLKQDEQDGETEQDEQDGKTEPIQSPAIFTTLRGGLQQLVNALVQKLDPERLHLGCAAASIEHKEDGWRVATASFDGVAPQLYDGIVLATPAWSAGRLLTDVDAELSAELQAIPYSSSATINLVFDGADLDPLPAGFGFLVPAVEKRAILACTFLHRKFSGRTASGKSILRVFVGGAHNAGLLGEPDEFLVDLVRRELFEILEISATPELTDVRRWPRAMAQYAVGHKDRLARIHLRLARLPGLYLAGNAYDGIGISDCIRLGRKAARDLAAIAELMDLLPATRQDAPAKAQSHK